MTDRILIVGAKGLLGTPATALLQQRPDAEVLAVDIDELDITDAQQVAAAVDRFGPTLVVNCAAYTNVDKCETEEALATRVNGDGPGHLARAAAGCGAGFIHISTDYVFDGTATSPYRPDDPPAPPDRLSAYGRSKLAGERAVQSNHPSPLIVRTAWLYGPDGPGFPATILRLARERPELRVVDDQRGAPTYAPDLARALVNLADARATGIVHVTNRGECTWYDFAREILRQAGLDTPVVPVTTAEFPRPAKRPAYSVLDLSRYEALTAATMPPWQDALARFVADD